MSDMHYEEKFEFPLWKLIKQRAQEKDISYSAAYREVLPEYEKTIRYKDTEWTDEQIRKRNKEIAELRERERSK
jgi:hypothetical protein